MKTLTAVCLLLFVAGVLLFLAQLWFVPFSADLFCKVMITDAALFVIVFVINFLIKENRQTDKINQGSKLED